MSLRSRLMLILMLMRGLVVLEMVGRGGEEICHGKLCRLLGNFRRWPLALSFLET